MAEWGRNQIIYFAKQAEYTNQNYANKILGSARQL